MRFSLMTLPHINNDKNNQNGKFAWADFGGLNANKRSEKDLNNDKKKSEEKVDWGVARIRSRVTQCAVHMRSEKKINNKRKIKRESSLYTQPNQWRM